MTAVSGRTAHHRPAARFTSRDFRSTMGLFATGVTILTTKTDVPHGMTANAFTSVSKDPALVLVCVETEAVMHGRILEAGTFAVSVLSSSQEDVARHFADRLRPLGFAQFEPVRWAPGQFTGAPLLERAMAWLECQLTDVYPAGDHSIFVGSVLDMNSRTDEAALLFYRGKFREVADDSVRQPLKEHV